MWIFRNDAFLSVVEDRNDRDKLVVRARFREDINNVFPDVEPIETTDSDYRFRVWMPRKEVADAMMQSVEAIDYDNFKSSIPGNDWKRRQACSGVWSVMHRAQQNANSKTFSRIL